MKNMIKILIADDHDLFRDGLKTLLKKSDNIKLIGEASNGVEVLKILKNELVDIAVLDIDMPKMEGIETIKILRKDFPAIKILVLTMHGEKIFIRSLIDMGVNGYILKNRGKEEFVEAINALSRNEEYLRGEVLNKFISSTRDTRRVNVKLTIREKEILKLIVNEHTTSEISEKLHVSVSTVDTHRRNLIEKTGVRNSLGLVRYAIENKLI